MKLAILLLTLLLAYPASAKTLKVAIIDTGLDINDYRFSGHVCPKGNKDFTGSGLVDTNSHGTHVAGLIQHFAGPGDYCFLIYKFYLESNPGSISSKHMVEAIQEAINNGASIVNISGGGAEFKEEEFLLIKNNPQVTFVVAAGNEGQSLDAPGNEFYPASYNLENEIVVGGVDVNGVRVPSSNYGKKVVNQELGENVLSYLPENKIGPKTGTSQATAIRTGKLIRIILNAIQPIRN